MEIIDYGTISKHDKIVIALGYFDSIHIGHKELLKTANELATRYGAISSSLLFTGSFKGEKNVFTLKERLIKLHILGIQKVVLQELNSEFMKKSPTTFINELLSFYNIQAIVVGEDFTFGYKGQGNVKLLQEICDKNQVKLKVVTLKKDEKGNKISSTAIKTCLDNGDVSKVNVLLGDNYFISGKVIKGKQVGKSIGFPTANIKIENDKYLLKQGVYYTCVILDGKLHDAITNVGSQPTFNGNDYVVETFINDFNGDLYDKTLTIYFIERIRDIVKFNSLDQLKGQLQQDKRWLK
ncbi:MAG: bifunctional riboflavin kinase/FAD synthetase [Clostridia bacterium]|nr:bifunctional riboflavin kinase/FAD synthetase [Clostridia bacterium]